ncbi:hypothetical protein AAGR22_05675 [Erwinia sp. HDF1-3R]|uniref:hypothetical protein n=1 Tax=Erwinia sp. HDF1-3R TaxID=3141543 RepID=UPI0031F5C1EA
MNELKQKKDFLYRKAQGNLLKDKYYKKIESLTLNPVNTSNFMSLEDTDLIIEKLNEIEEISRKKIELTNMYNLIDLVGGGITTKKIYMLLDEEWKFLGAYKVDGIIYINSHYDFEKMESDEIRLIAEDFSFYIQIDYDFNEITCEFFIYK